MIGRMTVSRRLRTPLQACALLLGLLAAATSVSKPLEQVLKEGKLRVGIALATPWAMRDEEGEFSGFEIDVARKLAADMDVELEILRYDFPRLVAALEIGEVDLLAAGLAITPERALHVNFSQPYATGGIGMATNMAATADVATLEQLNDPLFTVAALRESVAAEIAERVFPRAGLDLFATEDEAAEALLANKAQIYLGEEPGVSFLALEHPETIDTPINRPLLESRFAFAVAKGDPDFVTFLNAWINAREADTWLPTTHQYWFRSLLWSE
jgi:polar amino acid transport system substrate-binding protein